MVARRSSMASETPAFDAGSACCNSETSRRNFAIWFSCPPKSASIAAICASARPCSTPRSSAGAVDARARSDSSRFAFRPVEGTELVEIPVTTAQIGERRLAAGGGGFFRVLPYAFSRWAIARVNDRDERPAIFYFPPWEIDPDQPRMKDAPLRSRLRHYTNLSTMADKLRRLAGDFSWGRMDEIARIEAQRCVPFVS